MTTTQLRATIEFKATETLASTGAAESIVTQLTPLANLIQAAIEFDRGAVDLSHTLSGTTGSLDLTAAPLARETAVTFNLTDDYLGAVLLSAPDTNVGVITVKQGASNGFPLLGGASLIVLAPGDTVALVGSAYTLRQKVDSTHKTIDFAGTSLDKVNILAFFDTNT